MKINFKKSAATISLLSLVALTTGCGMSLRMATTHSIDQMKDVAYRTKAAESSAGYQEAMGLPSVAARFSERPGLKVAILQYGATIQGDISREFADVTNYNMMAGSTKFWSGNPDDDYRDEITYERKTLDAIEVPAKLGLHIATNGLKKLESNLREAGFDVIDSDRVVNTKAYTKYYGEYPPFGAAEKGNYAITSMASGWTTFAPLNHRVKVPNGMIDIGQAHWVWPDTKALQDIAAELNEDVLFIAVSTVFSDFVVVGKGKTRSRVGQFGSSAKIGVYDPKYVGVGIGGFGHSVAGLDASLTNASRPNFMKEVDGKFDVDWSMLAKESENTNDYYAKAFANTLKELRDMKK